jgi:hypothetical protein
MHELLDQLPRAAPPFNAPVLLDTCFFFYMAEHQKLAHIEELAQKRDVLISSFNAEEIVLKSHQVSEPVKERLRHWLHTDHRIKMININVHPGDWAGERLFVQSVEPQLLVKIHDASDAVLFAVALKHHCDVLTKDKHHLFTTLLENFANHQGIKVEKDIHDL